MTLLDGAGKAAVLAAYLAEYRLDSVVETGLYCGHGSGMGLVTSGLVAGERYLALDADQANVDAARAAGFQAVQGDSGRMLWPLLAMMDRPALIWLDAHYVSEFDGDPGGWAHPTPLLAELDAVLAWRHAAASVVLVDDLRLLGEPGWPSRADLERRRLGAVWTVTERDDILRLTPKGQGDFGYPGAA